MGDDELDYEDTAVGFDSAPAGQMTPTRWAAWAVLSASSVLDTVATSLEAAGEFLAMHASWKLEREQLAEQGSREIDALVAAFEGERRG